jgi:hypothetical protein
MEKPAPAPLELRVKELAVNSELFPGARAYSAKLTNTTKESISIEVHQAPPGYSGGGISYPCAVQFWNPAMKQWRIEPPGNRRLKNSVGEYLHSAIKPNETIEVCRDLLVKERIKGGRCARFAFTFHWDHEPDILSKPFVIPDPANSKKHIQCP